MCEYPPKLTLENYIIRS